MTAVIAITSGKARAGKSMLGTNLAQYLNQKGHRTGLLVAGASQPVWGIDPSPAWPDIVAGRLPVHEAIHRDVFGIDLMVTQGHGAALREFSNLADRRMDDPTALLEAYAYLIVDLNTTISAAALACCLAATETILVLTPDSPALAAGYEWLVHLARNGFPGPVNIILNQVRKPALVQSIYLRFKDLTQKRLKIQSNLWGAMSMEERIDSTAARKSPLSQSMPQSKLLRDIHVIGDRLVAEQPPENQTRPLKDFWQQFMDCLQQLPELSAAPAVQPREPVESVEPVVQVQEQAESEAPGHAATISVESDPPTNDARLIEKGSPALAHLSMQLTAIAQELNAIRRLLETGPFGEAMHRDVQKQKPSESIGLDFDAFISQHPKREE